LEGAAREWEKIRLELKRADPGYATDAFVMLELKPKLLFCFFERFKEMKAFKSILRISVRAHVHARIR